jgi:uncharacterized membrane protein YdbT with pleckstrin-like domain
MGNQSVCQFHFSFRWVIVPQLIISGGIVALCCLGALLWWPLILLSIFPTGYAYYCFLNWKTTIYTITPVAISRRSGIIFESRNEISISAILKKNLTVYINGKNSLGTIALETAGQSINNAQGFEGDLLLENIDYVVDIYESIEALQRLVKK